MTNAGWSKLTVHVPPGPERDAVVAALFVAGAQGIQELDGAVVTHAEGAAAAESYRAAALVAAPRVALDVAPLPDVDWSEAWKQSIRGQQVGRLAIVPPWLASDKDTHTTIIIEPAMAFGTGEHATTRGVVRLLQAVVKRGDRVADLGAGSAVLAIAAAKLGAAHAAAIELDADAIENAEENVRRNGVADRVVVIHGDAGTLLPLVAPVNVITANILSSVVLPLLPAMAAALAPGGAAIVSGILRAERDEVLRVAEEGGWRAGDEDVEDEWWSATLVRR